jgi:hypothetical protein
MTNPKIDRNDITQSTKDRKPTITEKKINNTQTSQLVVVFQTRRRAKLGGIHSLK